MVFGLQNKLVGLTAATLLLVTSNASAFVIVSDTTPWTLDNEVSTPEQAGIGSIRTETKSKSVFLDGFDSNLGTLLNVSLSFTSDWILTHEISGEDPSTGIFSEDNIAATGEASQTLTVDLFFPDGGQQAQSKTQPASCSDDDGSCSQNTGGPGSFNGSLSFLNLSDFIDVASVQLVVTNFLSALSDTDDFEDIHKSTARNSWDGVATITYLYDEPDPDDTPDPVAASEPAMLALMSLGLAGIGFARKKKKK